jgi:membrane-bound lytic murein transglycosylase D
MEQILKEEGVPVELIAVVFIESGFSLVAKSRASAVGPWQFIRDTGKRYGLTINNHRDERRDFVLATRAAARYLRDLYGYFGDWRLAMAAYNCGEGRVFRQISRQGTNDFYALDLPRETEEYVPEIHAALAIISDPQKYGFSTITADPIEWVEQELPGPVRVADLAAHCSMSIDEVKLLNPAWLRPVTPADGKPVVARLPQSVVPTVSLASLPLAPKEETVARNASVKIRKGDTLAKIARRNGVSVTALARENGLSTKSRLKAGRYLRLPDGVGVASNGGGGSSKKSKSTGGGTTVRFHTVKRGDTLSAICERYGLKMSEVKRLNGLAGSAIRAGQKLKLRG